MGASRKLQCEMDRVLKRVQEGVADFDSIWTKVHDANNANQREKYEAELKKEIKKLQRYRDQIKTWIQSSEVRDKKVNASYEKSLVDARKQIEREMERFKICEKEAKTKAFSKEGLEQQPRTDPRERAKSETRDWLNNVVGDLESQIDNFEAEIETVSTRKGKAKPTRLIHLEDSVVRHKAHIMKLELILRKLDNDELNPDEINDIKYLIEDYVERNQDDFNDFDDVNELYVTLPLDINETKPDDFSKNGSSAVAKVAVVPTIQQADSVQDSQKETSYQGSSANVSSTSLVADHGVVGASVDTNSIINRFASDLTSPSNAVGIANSHSLTNEATSVNLPGSPSDQCIPHFSTCTASVSISCTMIDDGCTASINDAPFNPNETVTRRIGQETTVGTATQKPSVSMSIESIDSLNGISNTGEFSVKLSSNHSDRNALASDSSRMQLQKALKSSDNFSIEANYATPGADSAERISTVSAACAGQWKPPTDLANFQITDQPDGRRRHEIAPDHVEQFCQRYQQIQQHGHSNVRNESHLLGPNPKSLTGQQHIAALQQFSQSSNPEVGFGSQLLQRHNYITQQLSQPNHMNQHLSQASYIKNEPEEVSIEDLYGKSNWNATPLMKSSYSSGDDSLQSYEAPKPALAEVSPCPRNPSPALAEVSPCPRNPSILSSQSLQFSQTSSALGVNGKRNSCENLTSSHDSFDYNLRMLEAAYSKLPQPRDSERTAKYIPAQPAVTPLSYPQMPLALFRNSAFWENNGELDTLFFAFYYQQNTKQQYLAAKELKKRAWRYHKKYHTWFLRHEEPKISTADYEQGSYVYFDFRIDGHSPQGWCQRIKNDFRFEYDFLEDELV